MKKYIRLAVLGAVVVLSVAASSSAVAQDRSLHALAETSAVVVADAAAVGAAYGAMRLASAEPCDGSGDGGLSCAMGVLGAGITAGSVVALFGGSLAAHLAGGMDGSYWSALGWGAVGLGGGLTAALFALTAVENERALWGTLIALPVLGHVIGTVAGYEASVPAEREMTQLSWTPTLQPRVGGAVAGVHGSF